MTDSRIDYVPLLDIMRLYGLPFAVEDARLIRIAGDERRDAGELIRLAQRTGSCGHPPYELPALSALEAEEPALAAIRIVRDDRDLPLRHPLYLHWGTLYAAAADLPAIAPAEVAYNHYDDCIVLTLP